MRLPAAFLLVLLAPPALGEIRHTGPDDVSVEVDYGTWKGMVGSGMPGFRYLAFAGTREGEPVYQLDGVGSAMTAQEWLGQGRREGGIWFFDSADGKSPEEEGRLTPRISLSCQGTRGRQLAVRGFVYFNAREVRCTCRRHDALARGAWPYGSREDEPAVHLEGVLFNDGGVRVGPSFTVAGALATRSSLRLARGSRVSWNPMLLDPPNYPPAAWDLPPDLPKLPTMFHAGASLPAR